MKVILAAVILGGVFGSASATIDSIEGDIMRIDIEVEVTGSADTVVAHLTFDDDPVLTLPLLDRGDGSFGIVTELEPKNYVVVFEVVGEESSDPVSLTQLGADLLPESGGTTTTDPDDESLSEDSRRSMWLAIALGAASLSLVAFWVLGGKDDKEGPDSGIDEEV
jgi:hypothetical protein